MRRRTLPVLSVGWLLGLLSVANTQPVQEAKHVGLLSTGDNPLTLALRDGLRERGWIESSNIILHTRWTEGKQDRAQAMAAELVSMGVAVIVAPSAGSYEEARRATSSIPIVFCTHGDPIGTGHVASLARPGGNMTGLSLLQDVVNEKKIEILFEAVPTIRRLGVLLNPSVATAATNTKAVEHALQRLNRTAVLVDVRTEDDLDGAFEKLRKEKADALFVIGSAFMYLHRYELSRLALQHQLPSMFPFIENAQAGGLMTYAPDLPDNYRRCAGYVDKILRGANPADLPIEQPTVFKLVINTRTAAALGVMIPPTLLARADEVIE